MVIDYRERRQVTKNRPKRKSGALIILTVVGIGVGIYSTGIATGWFLHGVLKKNPAVASAPVTAGAKQKVETPQMSQTAKNNLPPKTDEPLSFYYTLPKGEKMALGSGLNPQREDKRSAHREQSKTKENHVGKQLMQAGQAAESAGKKTSEGQAAENKPESKRKYTVQAASYSNRKDAEALKSSLEKNGFTPHVFESKIPGKGTWYRVRLGNDLDMETANKLAAKIGSGAIVVSE